MSNNPNVNTSRAGSKIIFGMRIKVKFKDYLDRIQAELNHLDHIIETGFL